MCLSCCFMCCYITCPPIPTFVTRKLAFNPPERGKSYDLSYISGSGNLVRVNSAKKAYGQTSIRIVPKSRKVLSRQEALLNSETFIVKASNRNYLVCLWMKPNTRIARNIVLIVAQPNASDLGDVEMFRLFADMFRAEVCVFDYSGYGLSTGSASEENIYKDIQSVFNFVSATKPNAKIVLLGISIGTAACIDLAAKNPSGLSGVVLVAALSSGCRLVGHDPARERSSCLDSFCSIDKIGSVDVPILLIHGLKDDAVPPAHSVALGSKIKNAVRPLYVHKASHNDILADFPEVYRRISWFIEREI